jgi:hypothetical protein
MSITGGKTIIVTGKYINFISGAGETGTVTFIPSLPVLSDGVDAQFLTVPPLEAVLPGTLGGSPNSSGPGTFSIHLPCTDNTELFPQGFTYIVEERITNLTRTTKGVQIPSTLGSTADLTVILAPYLTPQ